uniref:Uncharacterized protein n=1 Tax=Trichogramma kaykai TaxID=54128 RepID=A0ABD2WJW9_9HYME
MFLCKQVGTGTSSRTNTLTVPFEHFFSSLFQCTLHQLVKLQITFAPHSYGTHLFRYSLGYDTDHICSTTQQQQNINPGIHWEKEVIKRSHENYDVRQKATAEQEQEFISNTFLKKIQALKKEKETLAYHYEQEQECLTNNLSKKSNQQRQQKCRLEQTLKLKQRNICSTNR